MLPKYVYRVACQGTGLSAPMKADSMIDAAKKFLGTKNVRSISGVELEMGRWDCVVYRYRLGIPDPNSVNYYIIK